MHHAPAVHQIRFLIVFSSADRLVRNAAITRCTPITVAI